MHEEYRTWVSSICELEDCGLSIGSDVYLAHYFVQ